MAQSEGAAPAKPGDFQVIRYDAAAPVQLLPFPGFFASLRRKSTAAVTVASAETKQASASMLLSLKSKDWKGDAGRIKVRLKERSMFFF
jgi:hypothetical protein